MLTNAILDITSHLINFKMAPVARDMAAIFKFDLWQA